MTNTRFSFRAGCRVVFTGIFVGVFAAACSSLQTSNDFSKLRDRAAAGEGDAVAREILENWEKIPPDRIDDAIDALAAIQGPPGFQALKAAMDKGGLSDANKKRIMSHVIRRDDIGGPEYLLSLVQKNPALATENLFSYFGKAKYAPAIPVLKKSLDEGQLPEASVNALVQMDKPEAEAVITSAAEKKDHPARRQAMEKLPELKSPEARQKSVEIVKTTLDPASKESPETVNAALDTAGKMPYSDAAYQAVEETFRGSDEQKTKTKARDSMVKMRGLEGGLVEREAVLKLSRVQASLALWRTMEPASEKPHTRSMSIQTKEPDRTVTPQKPVEKTTKPAEKVVERPRVPRTSRRYGAAYSQQLQTVLEETMPEADASGVRNRVNNALLAYADAKTSTADFILRAYEKEFGTDGQGGREALRRGIAYPGSLSAVVRNVLDEYDNDAMRIYAIANMFGLPRWQASVILDLVRSGRI